MRPPIDSPAAAVSALHAAALDAGIELRRHLAACPICREPNRLCGTGLGLVRASQAGWRAFRLAGGRSLPG